MRAAALLLLAVCALQADAATIMVTITGTTGEIRVGEGPIFDHSSYQTIPPGAPFSLTYSFDDEKGKQSIVATEGGLITESGTESAPNSAPGVNAVLQIGTAVWEFGGSRQSHFLLNTAPGSKSADLQYTSQAGNRVSAQIVPAKGGFWPKNGDWRSSFTGTSIDGSTASFAADNDRVSASGKLIPSAIVVSGVDLDGQWLRFSSDDGWALAHPSPYGGYVVAEITRMIRGTKADGSPITPAYVHYWQAWRVAAGAIAPDEAMAGFAGTDSPGSKGDENVTVKGRFYEGLRLPAGFHTRLESSSDPRISTLNATLPVEFALPVREIRGR